MIAALPPTRTESLYAADQNASLSCHNASTQHAVSMNSMPLERGLSTTRKSVGYNSDGNTDRNGTHQDGTEFMDLGMYKRQYRQSWMWTDVQTWCKESQCAETSWYARDESQPVQIFVQGGSHPSLFFSTTTIVLSLDDIKPHLTPPPHFTSLKDYWVEGSTTESQEDVEPKFICGFKFVKSDCSLRAGKLRVKPKDVLTSQQNHSCVPGIVSGSHYSNSTLVLSVSKHTVFDFQLARRMFIHLQVHFNPRFNSSSSCSVIHFKQPLAHKRGHVGGSFRLWNVTNLQPDNYMVIVCTHVFEPTPGNYQVLRSTIILNQEAHNEQLISRSGHPDYKKFQRFSQEFSKELLEGKQ
ncbi:hypothetical protein C8R43DRAFT_952175 [Mycena crocata]|nr:hypothetical protein C8R43DRAFT_952175 [Mycena crocata]